MAGISEFSFSGLEAIESAALQFLERHKGTFPNADVALKELPKILSALRDVQPTLPVEMGVRQLRRFCEEYCYSITEDIESSFFEVSLHSSACVRHHLTEALGASVTPAQRHGLDEFFKKQMEGGSKMVSGVPDIQKAALDYLQGMEGLPDKDVVVEALTELFKMVQDFDVNLRIEMPLDDIRQMTIKFYEVTAEEYQRHRVSRSPDAILLLQEDILAAVEDTSLHDGESLDPDTELGLTDLFNGAIHRADAAKKEVMGEAAWAADKENVDSAEVADDGPIALFAKGGLKPTALAEVETEQGKVETEDATPSVVLKTRKTPPGWGGVVRRSKSEVNGPQILK